MPGQIDDEGYILYLASPIQKQQYQLWKQRMIKKIPSIEKSLKTKGLDKTMESFKLSKRDAALLARLDYLEESAIIPELRDLMARVVI